MFFIIGVCAICVIFAVGFVFRVHLKEFAQDLLKPSIPQAQPAKAPQPAAVQSGGTHSSVNLAVPFGSQAPFANWGMPYQEACEEAAAIMVHYYYAGKKLDAKTMDAEILKLVEWENKTFGYYKDTTAEEVARIMREYFGYKNAEVRYDISIGDVKGEIAAGRPVILLAAGRSLGNPNFRRPGPVYHALVVKGYMADGKIITNDPGTRRGADYLYAPDVLMNALHDWNAEDILKGRRVMVVVGG